MTSAFVGHDHSGESTCTTVCDDGAANALTRVRLSYYDRLIIKYLPGQAGNFQAQSRNQWIRVQATLRTRARQTSCSISYDTFATACRTSLSCLVQHLRLDSCQELLASRVVGHDCIR